MVTGESILVVTLSPCMSWSAAAQRPAATPGSRSGSASSAFSRRAATSRGRRAASARDTRAAAPYHAALRTRRHLMKYYLFYTDNAIAAKGYWISNIVFDIINLSEVIYSQVWGINISKPVVMFLSFKKTNLVFSFRIKLFKFEFHTPWCYFEKINRYDGEGFLLKENKNLFKFKMVSCS